MVTIFAAQDTATGTPRFIADVPRGAACGCVCLVCGSQLVAKKGDINDWHFAHEQSQERPECPAGAMNLLRRIAAEELMQARWAVAPYSVAYQGGTSPVTWSDDPAGPVEVGTAAALYGAVAATIPLVEHGQANVYVLLGRERAPDHCGEPSLRLVVPLPEGVAIRSEADARAFVRSNMRLEWLHLPDLQGRVAAAQKKAQDRIAALHARVAAQRAQEAGARWAGIRRGLHSSARDEVLQPAEAAAPAPTHPPRSSSAVDRGNVNWAPGLAGHGSIQYRCLKDGTQWVFYPAGAHGWRLAPVPAPFEGWDEYFPSSPAVADGPNWLRVVDDVRLVHWLGGVAKTSKIDSDPFVIELMFKT